MFVMGIRTYSDIEYLGSQSKASVERPEISGVMPDLAFKAPTCNNRDSSLFPHGKVGHFISQMRGKIFFNMTDGVS